MKKVNPKVVEIARNSQLFDLFAIDLSKKNPGIVKHTIRARKNKTKFNRVINIYEFNAIITYMGDFHKHIISVVLNTLNCEESIEKAIKSVKWADEVLVCDMHSEDKTVEIAKAMGAKVVFHKRLDYVEPARNFAVSKASGDWILVLDPDEEIDKSLKERLIQISDKTVEVDYVRIPRKNIIFGKWMKASGWWPDYNIRFFKKGAVRWTDKIHRPPEAKGAGLDLEPEEKWAIIHHNYQTVVQFIERMNRYTSVEARNLRMDGYQFYWQDLIQEPLGEFLSRYFANKGYLDGVHGFSLSLLQATSSLVVYLKVWEMEKFREEKISVEDVKKLKSETGRELNWWFNHISKDQSFWKKFRQQIF